MLTCFRLLVLVSFFLFFKSVAVSAQIITTVAGSSLVGDGDSATKANLNLPVGLAYDPVRQLLYIADQNNNRVRQVNLKTGLITTVAGNGFAYNTRNNVPTAETSLGGPSSIALDGSGNLYIADSGNIQIRKVDRITGLISIVAGTGDQGSSGDGGPAVNAAFDAPGRIAVDAAGNLYISDFTAHVIRKVTVSTGLISRVAGTYTNGFSGDGGSSSVTLPHLKVIKCTPLFTYESPLSSVAVAVQRTMASVLWGKPLTTMLLMVIYRLGVKRAKRPNQARTAA